MWIIVGYGFGYPPSVRHKQTASTSAIREIF